jgi:plasmid stabilization system protein ParE
MMGREYITPHGNVCRAIFIEPFIYFYKVDHEKSVVSVIAAYHGKQNY